MRSGEAWRRGRILEKKSGGEPHQKEVLGGKRDGGVVVWFDMGAYGV